MLTLLLFIHSLTFLPSENIEVSVANTSQIPEEWIALGQIEKTEIRTPYWVKVSKQVEPGKRYVLQGGNWYMQNLTFYNEQGTKLKTGNHLSFEADTRGHTFYIFYPFADEKDNDLFSIRIETEADFLHRENNKNVFQYMFQASLFFPLMVALSFLVMTREKIYLFYALYIFTVMGFFGYQYGLVGNSILFVNHIPPTWFWLFGFTITLFYALFSAEFLDLKHKDPKAWKIIWVGIIYMFFLFLMSTLFYVFKVDAQHSYYYKVPTIGIELVLVFALFYRIALLKGTLKNYYLVGALLLIVISITAQIMSTAQLIDGFNRIVQIGLVAEVFILSLGLGVRVYQIQKEKNQAQKSLIDQLQLTENLQKEYTLHLEEKVIERTKSLNEKNQEVELLLKEVHHRVKNNLQMISSLINLQERRSKNETLKAILQSTKQKVKSISLIHEHLYQSESLSQIRLDEYVKKLVEMNVKSAPKPIELAIDVPPFESDVATSIPIGLMLNELIMNSLKYAYEDIENPQLRVTIYEEKDTLYIQVWDNGKGFTDDLNDQGLGHTIIKSILETNDGTRTINRTSDGCEVTLQMKRYTINHQQKLANYEME